MSPRPSICCGWETSSARFVFDFGDRDLSLNEVVLGVEAVRSLRTRVLPVSEEDDIVAGPSGSIFSHVQPFWKNF